MLETVVQWKFAFNRKMNSVAKPAPNTAILQSQFLTQYKHVLLIFSANEQASIMRGHSAAPRFSRLRTTFLLIPSQKDYSYFMDRITIP